MEGNLPSCRMGVVHNTANATVNHIFIMHNMIENQVFYCVIHLIVLYILGIITNRNNQSNDKDLITNQSNFYNWIYHSFYHFVVNDTMSFNSWIMLVHSSIHHYITTLFLTFTFQNHIYYFKWKISFSKEKW